MKFSIPPPGFLMVENVQTSTMLALDQQSARAERVFASQSKHQLLVANLRRVGRVIGQTTLFAVMMLDRELYT